jgi:hypothetical protein
MGPFSMGYCEVMNQNVQVLAMDSFPNAPPWNVKRPVVTGPGPHEPQTFVRARLGCHRCHFVDSQDTLLTAKCMLPCSTIFRDTCQRPWRHASESRSRSPVDWLFCVDKTPKRKDSRWPSIICSLPSAPRLNSPGLSKTCDVSLDLLCEFPDPGFQKYERPVNVLDWIF